MHEELKLEGSVSILDDEAVEKLLQADMQARVRSQEQAATPMQGRLSHELQDGTIVYADNPEEVYRLCPVIGKMALEDPEKANALLMLAEIDNDDFDFFDEPHEQRMDESHEEPMAIARPTAEVEVQARVAEETSPHAPVITELSTQAQVDLVAQQAREEVELVHRKVVTTEQVDSTPASPVVPPAPMSVDERPAALAIVDGSKLIEAPATTPNDGAQPIPEKIAIAAESDDLVQPIDIAPIASYEEVDKGAVVGRPTDQTEPALPVKQADEHQIVTPVIVHPQHNEVEVEKPMHQVEALHDVKPEANNIARADKGSVTLATEAITVAQIDAAPKDPGRQEKPALDGEIPLTQQIFEKNLVTDVSRPQEIMDRIETSPLNEVLADVGRFVSQEMILETDGNTITAAIEIEEVNSAMQDIQLLLDKIDHELIDGSSAETSLDSLLLQDPMIKQELAEKVVKLFQVLGYEQSDERVRQLLDSYDTVFLKRSLENMCRLANGPRQSRTLMSGNDRHGRISQQLTAYIRQLLSRQLLQN